MKLQLALDTCDIKGAIDIVQDVEAYVDIIELGTPMLLDYGMETVRTLKKNYPNKTILADTKIMDAGEFEAKIAFNAGAHIVTVMGITHDETIRGAVKAAKAANGKVLADMMCVPNLAKRAMELVDLGIDYICVHTATDVQGKESPFESLAVVQWAVGSGYSAIAGGINKNSVQQVLAYSPEIVVVGNGITGQEDKSNSAAYIKELLG